jgi:hypothetical protein
MLQHTDLVPDSKVRIQNEAVLAGANIHPTSALIAFTSYVLCCVTFIVTISRVRNFWELRRNYSDNAAYLTIAQATVEGRFAGPDLQR